MRLIQPPKPKDGQVTNPFAAVPWDIKAEEKENYDQIFSNLPVKNGKITGPIAQKVLMETGLSTTLLYKVWELSDIEKTGQLDSEGFAVAMYLCEQVKRGNALPKSLPLSLVPPDKRRFIKD